MRLAGDRVGAPEGEASERFSTMAFRLDGVAGTGAYSLLDRR